MRARKVRKIDSFSYFNDVFVLYDYKAKGSRYSKGLTYFKKQGNHKSKPNTTFTKTEKKSTQA